MSKGYGDQLARGAVRATYGPLQVSAEKWESIFGKSGPKPKKRGKPKVERQLTSEKD
jgi:hypothetical protein